MTHPSLAAAAAHERDLRAKSYPEKIAAGANAGVLSLDFQCWVAIAEWLETDRFFGFWGGVPPEDQPGTVGEDGRATNSQPWVGWPALQAAAQRAVATAKDPERRAVLGRIHDTIARRRETIDTINRELRARQQQELAA